VDFDLAQVRAFLAVAELRHFSKAAARLNLTQQALSKRIQRLEQLLGEPLFARDSRAVELTHAGTRFLPHARALLIAADSAVAATRSISRPVRVDVWGHLQAPLRWMRHLTVIEPRLTVEVSMRRNVSAAIDALTRGEIDIAFGRVHDLNQPVPDDIGHRLVHLGPAGALLTVQHPLAQIPAIRPADLHEVGIWQPSGGATELTGYYQRFAKHFGLPLVAEGANLGFEHAIDAVLANPTQVIVVTADLPIPPDAGVRVVPLIDPIPRWPWSVVWRHDDQNPAVALLRQRLLKLSSAEGWTRFDPVRDWLPDIDLTELQHKPPPGVSRLTHSNG
jgi:DNA-binding transcriptional LysR family regulator